MQSTKSITLDTARGPAIFDVQQIDGIAGVKLFLRLTKVLGPALPGLARAARGGLDTAGKLEALAGLVSNLSESDYEHAQSVLLARCVARFPADGQIENSVLTSLGDLFAGRTFDLVRLVVFALEVNYSDFFGKVGALQKAPTTPATP